MADIKGDNNIKTDIDIKEQQLDINVGSPNNIETTILTENSTIVDIEDVEGGSEIIVDSTSSGELDAAIKEKETISTTVAETTVINTTSLQTGVTTNYNQLANKPKINGVELVGNKTTQELLINAQDIAYGENENVAAALGKMVTEDELLKKGYLTSYTESDPTVPSHVKLITKEDIERWNNNEDSFSGDYNDLKNKPVIPDSLADLHDDLGVITVNTVPKTTEDLVNNSGFITQDAIPSSVSEFINDANYVTEEGLTQKGYLTNYVETDPIYLSEKASLAKKSDLDDYILVTTFNELQTKVTKNTEDILAKPNYSDIPKNVSELNNDSGYLTEHQQIANVAKTGDYNDLINKPTIPTKVSQLTNDKQYTTIEEVNQQGFLKEHQDLSGYALKTEIPKKVSQLTNDAEYITNNELVAKDYVSNAELNAKNYTTMAEVESKGYLTEYQDLSNYATKNEIPTKVSQLTNDKQYTTKADVEAYDYVTNEELAEKGYITDHQDLSSYAKKTDIPTKTSQLTNDSSLVVDSKYVHTDNNYTTTEKNKLAGLVNYDDTALANRVTTAETTIKNNTTKINTNTQNITNNTASIGANAEAIEANAASIVTINNTLKNKADTSAIPTKLSQLSNDKGFITNAVNNLTNYYKKSEVYTQTEVNNLIANISTLDIEVVTELPATGNPSTIYLVAKDPETNDIYDEYLYINAKWERIGTTAIDLSPYALKTEIPTAVSQLTNDKGYLTTHQTVATVAKTGSYNDLTDKPTIPTVNNATLTIQKNGTSAGTFTANASANKTINITVPTDNNELANGAGYITSAGSITGNAATATKATSADKLTTARNINGVAFDGSKAITVTANPTETALSGIDLNTTLTPGFYYGGGSNNCTNKPSNVDAFGLIVYKTANGYTTQELTEGNTTPGKKYIRQHNSSTWSAWTQMKYTDSNTTYTLTQDASDGHKITLTPSSGTATTITIPDNNTTYSAATTSANGLMTSADKTKMNNTNVAWGTCSTAAATAAKVITISGNTNWTLTAGSIIGVKFSATNTAQNPTFNVNDTGAKSVWYNTAIITTGNLSYAGVANRPMYYMYDGTQYVCLGWSIESNDNTIPSAYCSTAAGTAAKTASCSGYALRANSHIQVILTAANSAASALTLNINSKGAKPIYINGTASSASNYTLPAGSYDVYYNGTNYYFRTDGKLTGDITGNAATASSATKATQDSDGKEINKTYTKIDGTNYYVQLTGGAENTTGYRLVLQQTLATWTNCRIVLSIASRHQGTGTLSIGVSTGADLATFYQDARFFGANTTYTADSWLQYYNAETGLYSLFWKYSDYSPCNVSVIKKLGFKDNITNGTWMTSIDTATYGTKYAVSINAAQSASSATSATTASKVANTLTIQKNGTNVATFNGSAAATANITVPTNTDILNLVYPVGSLYLSTVSTNPGTLIGGTWEAYATGRTLVGIDANQTEFKTAGGTGGSKALQSHTHSISITSGNQSAGHTHSVGAHAHGLNSHTHSVGAHSHGLNGHTHSIPALSGWAADAGNHNHPVQSYNMATGGYECVRPDGYSGQNGQRWIPAAGQHGHNVSTNASTTGGNSGSTANSGAFNTGGASGNTANSTAFNTGGVSANHTHSVSGTSGSTGDGSSGNLPPYIVCYIWKRTA